MASELGKRVRWSTGTDLKPKVVPGPGNYLNGGQPGERVDLGKGVLRVAEASESAKWFPSAGTFSRHEVRDAVGGQGQARSPVAEAL